MYWQGFPSQLIIFKELVIGRLRTAGLISGADDVEKLFICGQGNLAEVTLKEDISLEPYGGVEPSCCAGNIQLLSPAGAVEISELPKVKPDESVVFSLAESFVRDSALHLKTGGTHSCYLYLPDGGIACYEDISRHNALDKAVGRILLDGADPLKCVLYTTGRVPADMVRKALMAGVPVLVSKSVPTDAAVELANKYNLNLICRADGLTASRYIDPVREYLHLAANGDILTDASKKVHPSFL